MGEKTVAIDKMTFILLRIARTKDHDPIYMDQWEEEGDYDKYNSITSYIASNQSLPSNPAIRADAAECFDCVPAKKPTLDIHLGKATGMHAFFFQMEIDPHDKKSLLYFTRGDPFMALPVHYAAPDLFVEQMPVSVPEWRWASCIIDVKAVRASALATQLKKLSDCDPRIGTRMCLPFAFNVVDPRLEFAPWVLPDHEHKDEEEHEHVGGVRPSVNFLTHGGVHPRFASFLTVDLV